MNSSSLDNLISDVIEGHPEADSLEQLTAAAIVADALTDRADALVSHFVDRARLDGAPWSAIGTALGVTKQAAQKRWVTHWDEDLASSGRTFRRFTDRAKAVLASANLWATGTDAAAIGPVDIFLGLFAEPDGLAAQILRRVGVDEQRAAAALGRTAGPAAMVTGIGFDGPASDALDAAVRDALQRGVSYVGTEHLLMGLLAAPEAAPLLEPLGLDTVEVERLVAEGVARLTS